MILSLIILKKGAEHVFVWGLQCLLLLQPLLSWEHDFRVVVILGLKAKPVVNRTENLFFFPMTLKFKNLTPKIYRSNILGTSKLLK